MKNAVSGTYSVDDGPTKTFTSTASVVLGQGKVADSTVTVKATATDSDGTTKAYTFTYNKQFNGTVNEEENAINTASVSNSYEASSQGLASQYSTNKVGVGVKKTISVDGSLSDWDSTMLIAQGAAMMTLVYIVITLCMNYQSTYMHFMEHMMTITFT